MSFTVSSITLDASGVASIVAGQGQGSQGISLVAFVTALATALIVFGIQIFAFLLLKDKIARIFKPKTYLVPERERVQSPPMSLFGWLFAIFKFKDRDIIKKCGLDAYFFLRYLQTLLIIFIPLGLLTLPILLPINIIGGRGPSYALEFGNRTDGGINYSSTSNVTGLDLLAWGNVRPAHTHRYWAHLILAVIVIIWVCSIFFFEFKVYIKVRQDYLTSAEHRLKASATTILVTTISSKWLTIEALGGLYNVFPGGIRNIWINRDYSELLDKIRQRDAVFKQLEGAQTELIRAAKRAQRKELEKDEKKARKESQHQRETKEEKAQRPRKENVDVQDLAESGGVSMLYNVHESMEEGNEEHGRKGARNIGEGIQNQGKTTNGFVELNSPQIPDEEMYDPYGHYRGFDAASPYSADEPPLPISSLPDNAIRHQHGRDGAKDGSSNKKWFEFWKPPSNGFASPVPTGYEDSNEFPLKKTGARRRSHSRAQLNDQKKGFWFWIKTALVKDAEPLKYPKATNPGYREGSANAVWEKYLKPSERPTHRLSIFGWLPAPLIGKKVDTIYWCRGELAKLNLEIEVDQKHPERFPKMNSAFIQFNYQVAAHMASQAISHHLPKQMALRSVEISPKDVIWDNMSIKWWEAWLRTVLALTIVASMIILWTFPVAITASISQINSLANKYSWLKWLKNIPRNVLQAIAGVVPAILLAVMLAIVPVIFDFLAAMQGAKTGTEKQQLVQSYYFMFLFTQVFLVVSVSAGALATLSSTTDVAAISETLATELPKAANYFFSYMILQALSISSGTLLQVVTLILWYLLPKLLDNTARQKWTRNTTLPNVIWGKVFPIYTNFACIALIYIIVSPIIILFAIIMFTLFWIANRYNMLYVSRFELDTGGLLYPRAINQTFTGLYFMEVCLVGLFFLVRDENGNAVCVPQAIIMIVAIFLTVIYQVLLNWSFGPLFRYLPITFEDEAVLRDKVFEQAQSHCLGLNNDVQTDGTIEMSLLNAPQGKLSKFNPTGIAQGSGPWANKPGGRTFGLGNGIAHRRDLQAQNRIADALYGGYNDELEDLTPDERNTLVKHAFQHEALRARRPTIWIPRDDIGVSDDEVKRTRDLAGKNILISSFGAALDGRSRVIIKKNPPDFSEIDLINL